MREQAADGCVRHETPTESHEYTAMRTIFLALALFLLLAPLPTAAHHVQSTPMLEEEFVQCKAMEQQQPAAKVSLNAYSDHDARIALYIQIAMLAVGVLLLLVSIAFMICACRKLKIANHLHRLGMERRDSVRYPMATDRSIAMLHTPSGDMAGAPVDISESGIQIVLDNAAMPKKSQVKAGSGGFRLSLMLPDDPGQCLLDATCSVAWICGQRCGLRFEMPITLPPLFERHLILARATL